MAKDLPLHEQTHEQIMLSRGLKIPFYRELMPWATRRALRRENYEFRESEAVLKMVTPEDVVLELGGGIGYMSALIETHCKPVKIHSYEANPTLMPIIDRVQELNNITTVTMHNKLLAKRKTKPVDFYVREEFLSSSMDRDSNPNGIVSTEKIEVDNINTVLKTLKPTFLVCDIEGAEAELFTGVDLSCLRAAVIELHPQWIGQTGVQAVFDAMHAAGLTFYPRTSNKKVVAFMKGW